MRIGMKKKLATLVTISLLLFGAGAPADAAFVNQWDYTLFTVFNGNNTFTSGTGTQIQQPNQVSWGVNGTAAAVFGTAARSGITIAQTAGANQAVVNVTGTYFTNSLSNPGQGHWITHHNKPISASYATLLTSQIASTLTLVPKDPALAGQFGPATITFTINFKETPNAGPCVAGTGNPPCGDIFALQADAFNAPFTFYGQTYYVSIFPTDAQGITLGPGLPILSTQACQAADIASGVCVGFVTPEDARTSVRFGFVITGEPINIVPEPSTFVLIGAGLVGLGLAARRRMK